MLKNAVILSKAKEPLSVLVLKFGHKRMFKSIKVFAYLIKALQHCKRVPAVNGKICSI